MLTYAFDYWGDGEIMTTTYNDDRINTISSRGAGGGGVYARFSTTYNENLDIESYTHLDDPSYNYAVTYVYDEKGNWTTMDRTGKYAEEITRTVTYF